MLYDFWIWVIIRLEDFWVSWSVHSGGSHHNISSLTTLRLPCCEEAQASCLEKLCGMRENPIQSLVVPAVLTEVPNMWVKKPSWLADPTQTSDDWSQPPSDYNTMRGSSTNHPAEPSPHTKLWKIINNRFQALSRFWAEMWWTLAVNLHESGHLSWLGEAQGYPGPGVSTWQLYIPQLKMTYCAMRTGL